MKPRQTKTDIEPLKSVTQYWIDHDRNVMLQEIKKCFKKSFHKQLNNMGNHKIKSLYSILKGRV